MRSNGADPHHVLGVARDATEAEIKRAYRALAKRHHPDADHGSIAQFLEVQAAYEALLGSGPASGGSGATTGGPGSAARRPAQPGGPAGAGRGSGSAGPGAGTASSSAGAGGRGPSPGAEWARRPRGAGARRPDAGAAAGPGSTGGGTRRSGEPAARPRPEDGSRGRRSSGRRRATLGSTSYDEAEEIFEPDWRGASWYGPSSGTFWTINPKEYADPRKHGPEYQARARRGAGGGLAGESGAAGEGAGGEGVAGGVAGESGTAGESVDPGPPGEAGADAKPPGGVGADEGSPRDLGASEPRPAARSGVGGDAGAEAPTTGDGDAPERPRAAPGSTDHRDRGQADDVPPSWRAQAWTAASHPGAGRAAFKHDPLPGGGPPAGDGFRGAWQGGSGPPVGGAPPRPASAAGASQPPSPAPRPAPFRSPRRQAPAAIEGPGIAARVVLAVIGWLVPGLAIAALAGLPGGFLATLPIQAAGIGALAFVPRAAWASIGGGLALAFAAVPIVAFVAALGGPFVPGGPAPEAAVVLAALAWALGVVLVGAGRVAPYPWRIDA